MGKVSARTASSLRTEAGHGTCSGSRTSLGENGSPGCIGARGRKRVRRPRLQPGPGNGFANYAVFPEDFTGHPRMTVPCERVGPGPCSLSWGWHQDTAPFPLPTRTNSHWVAARIGAVRVGGTQEEAAVVPVILDLRVGDGSFGSVLKTRFLPGVLHPMEQQSRMSGAQILCRRG